MSPNHTGDERLGFGSGPRQGLRSPCRLTIAAIIRRGNAGVSASPFDLKTASASNTCYLEKPTSPESLMKSGDEMSSCSTCPLCTALSELVEPSDHGRRCTEPANKYHQQVSPNQSPPRLPLPLLQYDTTKLEKKKNNRGLTILNTNNVVQSLLLNSSTDTTRTS